MAFCGSMGNQQVDVMPFPAGLGQDGNLNFARAFAWIHSLSRLHSTGGKQMTHFFGSRGGPDLQTRRLSILLAQAYLTGNGPIHDFAIMSMLVHRIPSFTACDLDISQALFIQAFVFQPENLQLHISTTTSYKRDNFVYILNGAKCRFTCAGNGTKEMLLSCNPVLLLVVCSDVFHFEFLVLTWIGNARERIAQRVGRVRMHFNLASEETSIKHSMTVFTQETLQLMSITLY